MAYEIKLRVGQYKIDENSFLDVRITDIGPVLSVCDQSSNTRYTLMIDSDTHEVVIGEVDYLVPESDAVKPDATATPDWVTRHGDSPFPEVEPDDGENREQSNPEG